MSKVLVDRELLDKLASKLDGADFASYGWGNLMAAEVRGAIAKPAEAEGVEVVAYVGCQARMTTDGWENGEEHVVFADQASDADKRYDVPLMTVTQHLAALSAVTAERDRLQRNLKFTEQWYAERFERLADLGKSAGCWDAMAAIIANGTADPYEPPTYAQQLVRANHRADVAERERDQLRAEVEALRNDAERYRWASSGVHEAETLVSIVNCHGGYAEKVAERVDVYREAAMAAKEA